MTLPNEVQHPIATVSSAARRTFRSLRVRNYRLWFTGQTISLCGTWMQSTAQAWLVYQLTHSAVDLGLTAALQFAPVLLFGAYGGVIADRFDKRKVLMVTQTAFMIQATGMWLLVFTGVVQLWMVWVMATLMGLINVIDNPSRQSFAIEMVGREDLANAVGLNSVIVNSSRIVGPAVAGAMIAATNLSLTFLVNAATFVAVLTSLVLMRPSELDRAKRVPRAKGQIRAGFSYAWSKWELRLPLLMMAVVGTLSYNFTVLLPLFASGVFHSGGGTFGALTATMGVGSLAGSLGTAARHRPGYRWLIGVTGVFGLFCVAVALAPTLGSALVLLVPLGAMAVAFIATTNSLLQLHAADGMRGRVMALWAIVFLGSTPIGAPLTGFLAAHLGPRLALVFAGVVALFTAIGSLAALRRMRTPAAVWDEETGPQTYADTGRLAQAEGNREPGAAVAGEADPPEGRYDRCALQACRQSEHPAEPAGCC